MYPELHWEVGSMDYIHSLLIAEDDLDDLNEEGNVLVMTESEETEQSLISALSRFNFYFH